MKRRSFLASICAIFVPQRPANRFVADCLRAHGIENAEMIAPYVKLYSRKAAHGGTEIVLLKTVLRS